MKPFEPKKLFYPRDDDVKMSEAVRTFGVEPSCKCLDPQYGNARFGELGLHAEVQDTESEAWKLLESLIENAASRGSSEFAPGLQMPPELWAQIVTLPRSIAKLTSVKRLYLYRSYLVRIPPEIGQMINLEELDLYTSYRLHRVPFEVTHCKKLTKSRVSTRALYGNYKYRPPFPRVHGNVAEVNLRPGGCSVCGRSFSPEAILRVWISLRVATDVLPLLVHACSQECIGRLPAPACGYVDRPHTGGFGLPQPAAGLLPKRPK